MEKKKPKPLETKKSEVKPEQLPEGKNHMKEALGYEDNRTDPINEEAVEEKTEEPDNRPRPERRRSRREKIKTEKKMRSAMRKYHQHLQRPLRIKDLQTIVDQSKSQLQPALDRIEHRLDQLMLLPDYIASCISTHPAGSGFGVVPSVEGFQEFIEEYEARLEKEAEELDEKLRAEQAEDVSEEEECICGEEGCFRCTPGTSQPETEATQ